MTALRLFDRMLAPAERLVAALCDPARRERTVLVVLAAYVALWTLYGTLAKGSQDIHVDMAEMFAWSRHPAIGYAKHPPLGAWLTAAWFAVFPATDAAFYLLAMTTAAAGLWFAWKIAGDYLEPEKRVLALALLMLVPFFNFHALKFNANTVLIPAWAATAWWFLRSYERRSALWGALAGLGAAAAMLGKYWSLFLLAGLGLAALIDPRRARYFGSAPPRVTIVVGAIALAPHVAWLVADDFEPLTYAAGIHVSSHAAAALSVIGYLAGSAGYVVAPVLLAVAAMRPGRADLADMLWPADPKRRLVALSFWLPLLLPVLAAPLARLEITSLWSMSAWALLPVVMLSGPVAIDRRAVAAIVALAIALPPLMAAAAPLIAAAIHRQGDNPSAGHTRLLAQRVEHEWRLRTQAPLRTVGGSSDLAYGVAFYLPERPSAFPGFSVKGAPWIDRDRVRREGMAIVCAAADRGCAAPAHRLGLTGERIELELSRSHLGVPGRPARYAIEIVPPRP